MYLFGSIIADAILILTFAISIFAGYRKGFSILVFNLICWLITIIAVLSLCKPLTAFVYENTKVDEFFSKHIKNTIGDFIEGQLEKSNHINTGKTNISRPIAEKINKYIDEAEDKAVENTSTYISNKLAYIVVSALVVITLCIVIRISTIFLRAILYFITELPIMHSIDKAGGITYGIIRAYIIIYLILGIFSLLSPLMANTGLIASINASKFCSRYYNNNVFLNILIK